MKDGVFNQTSISYDAWGRADNVVHPGSTGTVSFTYDFGGNRLSATDELSRVNSWLYDDAGKMTRWTNARNDQENYVYNNMGWMTSVVNGRGKTRTMEHTDRGEVKSQTLADG